MSPNEQHHDASEHRDRDGDSAERLMELMAQRAVIGLDDAEVDELQSGLAAAIASGTISADDLDVFDELAARASLAILPEHDADTPPLPSSLRERLIADCVRAAHGRPTRRSTGSDDDGVVRRDPERAGAFIAAVEGAETVAAEGVEPAASPADAATTASPAPAPAPAPSGRPPTPESTADPAADRGVVATIGPWLGWIAAAAILVLAVLPQPAVPPAQDTPLSAESLMALASDVIEVPLTGIDGVADDAAGRILWSESLQAGVLEVRGLAANDPSAMQYQLWLFDRGREQRNEQNPAVDGGVFDVPADGTLEIPIDAKLPVFEPHLFAITSEPAGGVVKHDPELDPSRFRIVAVAPIDA